MSARFINLEFIDETENGWLSCTEVEHENLIAYKIPGGQLEKHADLPEVSHSGIYILVGKNKENKDTAYIGQVRTRKNGDSFRSRLKEHSKNSKKVEFWNGTTIIFTKKYVNDNNDNFDPTQLDYLEALFIEEAIKAGRYEVENIDNIGSNQVSASKSYRYAMEQFFEVAKTFVYSLGCDIFVKNDVDLSDVNDIEYEDSKIENDVIENENHNISPLGRNDVKDICALCDCTITQNLSRAKRGGLNGLGNAYANDSNYSVLDSDWTLALDNYVEKTLYIFIIPKGEINKADVAPKHSEEGTFSINIKNDYPVFTDTRRSIKFGKYLKATIDYKNREKPICELNDKYMLEVDTIESKIKKTKKAKRNINKPSSFVFQNKKYTGIKHWKDITDIVIHELAKMDSQKLYELARMDYYIATKDLENPSAFLTLSLVNKDEKLYSSLELPSGKIYYKKTMNSKTELIFLNKLIKEFGIYDELVINVPN